MQSSRRAAKLTGAAMAVSAGVAMLTATPAEAYFFGNTKNHLGMNGKLVGEAPPTTCPNVYFDWKRQGVGAQLDPPRTGVDSTWNGYNKDLYPSCDEHCDSVNGGAGLQVDLGDQGSDQSCRRECKQAWEKHFVKSYDTVWLHKPRSWASVGTGKPHPDWSTGYYAPMDAWEKAGVPNTNQDSLIFTILNKPHKDAVKFIAFFVSGQEACEGYPQTTTGTNEGWKLRINEYAGKQTKSNQQPTKKWHSGPATLDKRGAAGIFMDGFRTPTSYGEDLRVFDLDSTLVIAVPDVAFSYPGGMTAGVGTIKNGCNAGNKQVINTRMLKGWKNWLGGNVNWINVKGFMGYGMSRGGCFVTRFSDYLFSTVPEFITNDTKLILETVDAVCNPDEWQSGISTDHKREDHAIRSPFNFILSDYVFQPVREKTFRDWHPQNLQAGLPRSRCNGIHVNKLFGKTKRENIRWLNSVAGADVLEWDPAGVGYEIFGFCDDRTATATKTYATGNGKRIVGKAPISEYQNLLVHFDNTVVRDGKVAWAEMFSQTALTSDDLITHQPSNNHMPEDCDAWYKQAWMPVTHAFIGSAYTQANVLDVSTNNVPCFGQSACGFGTKQSWKSDDKFSPLPANFSPWMTTCKPNPRADLDFVYKHMRHAANSAAEWFALGKPSRAHWYIDGQGAWHVDYMPNPKYRPITTCAQRQFLFTGSLDDPESLNTKKSLWSAKFAKQGLGNCVADDIDEEDGGVLSSCTLGVVDEKPLSDITKQTACNVFAFGGKLTDLMEDAPEEFESSPNAYEELYRNCSPVSEPYNSKFKDIAQVLDQQYISQFSEEIIETPGSDADLGALPHIEYTIVSE